MRISLVIALAALASKSLVAQCRPNKDQNEAKLLAYFSGPIAFSPGGTPERLRAGAIVIGGEATYVPSPPAEITRTGTGEVKCFLSKSENTELTSVFPRPRVAIGLPGDFVLEGSYLPPITVADAQPNLGSFALSRVTRLATVGKGRTVDLDLRAHATVGRVKGPITCPEKALQRTSSTTACYGSEPSLDTYKPNMFGGEAGVSTWGSDARFGAYAGAGFTSLKPRFQVGFRDANGHFDSTRVEVDLTRGTVFGGASYRVLRRLLLSAEVYSVPADLTTGRVGARYQLR